MNSARQDRLFGLVMLWTTLTAIFAWLPLVRIIGRAEGYSWRILGAAGTGTDGPFWIFVPLTLYVVVMLFAAHRLPRLLFYPLLLVWQFAVAGVVVAAVVAGGSDAGFQGQGLRLGFPLWLALVPACGFAVLAVVWVALDARAGGRPTRAGWTRTNLVRAAGSVLLLAVAVGLFRLGTNYNAVTAAAIVATVVHWVLLVESFAPARPSGSATAL